MPDKKLDENIAIDLMERVYELLQIQNIEYQSHPESAHILNSKGELYKKIRFSALDGYDIIDVLNSFKLALALSYMNPDFDESVFRLLDDTQNEITSIVLKVFMPDEILDWVDYFEESASYDDYRLAYAVDIITGNSKKLVTDDDKFYYQKEIIGESDFNHLSKDEKRVYFINELYHSDSAKIWYNKLNQYIEDGGSFLEFYEILKKINCNDRNDFMLQVKKNLGFI